MNYAEPDNLRAFHPSDRYMVVNEETKKIVQSEFSPDRAERACAVLNEHERRRGRVPTYAVIDAISDTYLEGALYGFVRTADGTEPANGLTPDGWCVYLHRKNKLTGDFVEELFDEDFDDAESAHLAAERLGAQHGTFHMETY